MDNQRSNTRPLCMRAVIYSRVSTDAQEREGTSLDTQERACLDFAQKAGWQVVECIRDAASGFTLDRPGVERMRSLLRGGAADTILAFAVDRLSRNQNHIGVLFDEVEQAGARLEFVTEKFEDTAVGRLILNVRAFVGEVEREKIAERTMRGKAERARSGRIPQGTGRGIYGYVYNRDTGRREIDSRQGAIVQEIFRRFCDGASCNGIALHLNALGEPALGGGILYPLTVRRILLNETYTGRTIYRRTRAATIRDPRTGKKRRRVEVRLEADWIEVREATPPIISKETYAHAQAILGDPARRLLGRPTALYRLRGHLRCLACGTPMVGQALQRGRFRYYRCRRSYAGFTDSKCASKYVRADALEQAVLREVSDLLSDPRRVIDEVARLYRGSVESTRLGKVLKALTDVESQQKRLVRLFTAGTLPESILDEESGRLNQQRQRLEQERQELDSVPRPTVDLQAVKREMPLILQRIRYWVEQADGDKVALLLRALGVQVSASSETVEIEGYIPAIEPSGNDSTSEDLVTIEQTSA